VKILIFFQNYDINIVELKTDDKCVNIVYIQGLFYNPTTVDYIIKDLKNSSVVIDNPKVSFKPFDKSK